MIKRLIFIFLILTLFFSVSEGAVKKHKLAIDGYQNQVASVRAIPYPDSNGGIAFFESCEPASGVYSGFDNSAWTLTNCTGCSYDQTSPTHTGYGLQLFDAYSLNGALGYIEKDFSAPSWNAAFTARYFIRFDDTPDTNRITSFWLKEAGESFSRLRQLTTGNVSIDICTASCTAAGTWTNGTVTTPGNDEWHMIVVYFTPTSATITFVDNVHADWSAGGQNIGTADADSGNNTLEDDAQAANWATDEHLNHLVKITGGTGEGQIRLISGNDTDTLTVSANWITNPNATSTYEINGGVVTRNNADPGTSDVNIFRPGYTTAVSTTLDQHIFYDDLAIRNCSGLSEWECFLGDWSSYALLTDSSDNTGWEAYGESESSMFTLADAADTDDPDDGDYVVKAIRAYTRAKQKSSTQFTHRFGWNYSSTIYEQPEKTFSRAALKSTPQDIFSQHEKNAFYGWGAFDWTSATCGSGSGACGVNNILSTLMTGAETWDENGAITTKAWMDVIYGKSGDAFLTDGPVFGAGADEGSTSTIKVWGRTNEATDLMVRYSTDEDYVVAGYDNEGTYTNIGLSSPVSVTSTTNFSTPNSGIEITGLTPATIYYIDFLVEQAGITANPIKPHELRLAYGTSGENGDIAVGDRVFWNCSGTYDDAGCSGEGNVVYCTASDSTNCNDSDGTVMVKVADADEYSATGLTASDNVYKDASNYFDLNATATAWDSTYRFEGTFSSNTWDTASLCTANDAPWPCCSGSVTGVCPPQFTSHLADGYSSQFNISPSGDIHVDELNNQIWTSIGKENIQQWIHMGDEYAIDIDNYFTNDDLYTSALMHRNWDADGLYYWQNVLSKMEFAKIISDHEIENNANKMGDGDFGDSTIWLPVWKAIQSVRDTSPFYALGSADDYIDASCTGTDTDTLVDTTSPEKQFTFVSVTGGTPNPYCLASATDIDCDTSADSISWNGGSDTGILLYYDPIDLIMIVSHTQSTATLATDDIVTNGTWSTSGSLSNIYDFPTVSKWGIYPGMVINNISDTAEIAGDGIGDDNGTCIQGEACGAFGIVKYNTGVTIQLTSALTASGSFTSGDDYRIKRAGLFYTFTQGNANFTMLDIRSRRDPNKTPNGDKFDGTSYPFMSQTASSCMPKEITGDAKGAANYMSPNSTCVTTGDCIVTQTGTTSVLIKHLDPDIETDLANKWDMACAWNSTDATYRGCALISNTQNTPSPAIFGQDDFNGTADNTILSTHVADVGGWKEHPSFTTDMNVDGSPSTYARGNSGTVTSVYYNNGTPVNAEYDVQAELKETYNGAYYTGLCGRVSSSANTMYCVNFRGTAVTPYAANTWVLQEIIAGVTTDLGSYTGEDILNITKTVKLEIRDATKKVYIGGVERISHSATNDITAAGYSAIMGRTVNSNNRGSYIDNFVATNSTAGTYGDITLEWEILGLVATDRVRFFESGASSYFSSKEEINHGHVQRAFVKTNLDDNEDEAFWGIIGTETPFHSKEIATYDKWGDYDNLSIMKTFQNVNKWTLESDADKAQCGDVALQDCYYYDPVDEGEAEWYEKPGAVNYATTGGKYEVANKSDINNPNDDCTALKAPYSCCTALDTGTCQGDEWWWDATNKRVYIHSTWPRGGIFDFYYSGDRDLDCVAVGDPYTCCGGLDIGTCSVPYWDRCASRRYLKDNFGYKNKIVTGADRHLLFLANTCDISDPWYYILSGGLAVARDQVSARLEKVNGLYAHYHSDMGAWVDPASDPSRYGGYSLLGINYNNIHMIRVMLKERNATPGFTESSAINLWSAKTGDAALGYLADSYWLHYMMMDILWKCPYGNCDYFDRVNSGSLCTDLDYCNGEANDNWVIDTITDDGVCDEAGELCINSNEVKSATDGTGISHWATSMGSTDQYAQIKITSTSTDGDVGVILRSEATSGNRYALVYDEGAQAIKWQRYNWNTYTDEVTPYFQTTYHEYTNGDIDAADWDERWNTTYGATTVADGTGLGLSEMRIDHTGVSGWYGITWNDVNASTDVEILAKGQTPITADGVGGNGLALRASGATGSESLYFLTIRPYNDLVMLERRIPSGTTQLATDALTIASNTWYWMRFRVNGTGATVSIKAKVWANGTSEPAGWNCADTIPTYGCIEYDDVSADRITGAGWVGMGSYHSTGDDKWDYLSVGLNGATAPSPVDLANNTWLSTSITGTGSSTTMRVWVDTVEPNYYPFSIDRWQDADDTPTYTLTCSGTCAADTGTYAGIIIKDETGANSPTLDDFYSGDVSGGWQVGTWWRGVQRGMMRGIK